MWSLLFLISLSLLWFCVGYRVGFKKVVRGVMEYCDGGWIPIVGINTPWPPLDVDVSADDSVKEGE